MDVLYQVGIVHTQTRITQIPITSPTNGLEKATLCHHLLTAFFSSTVTGMSVNFSASLRVRQMGILHSDAGNPEKAKKAQF